VRRRGRNLLLSPLDWSLIEAWKERGIPLHVVVRGIETVFDAADSQPARKRAIKSLMYCREEVEAQYSEWLSRQVGNEPQAETQKPSNENQENSVSVLSSQFSVGSILSHLQQCEKVLRSKNTALNHNWSEVSAQIANKLQRAQKEFAEKGDFDKLENLLGELDYLLDKTLVGSFPQTKLAAIKTEIVEQLGSYKNRMSEEAYKQTCKTLLLKSLHEQTGLPRLSLFYL
jgi:ElaB/YqjD/DUF883 family membrane-anchored ribosome-binding protein